MTTPLKICAVLTAFNRREKTLGSLRSFFNQKGDVDLSAVLMDDGSTDGTTAAVRSEFRNVTVLQGNGSLYWNRGMAEAFKEACAQGADYYLWLNDDTTLYSDALSALLEDAASIGNSLGSIIIGSTKDPQTGAFTYGGMRTISKWHAGKFARLEPSSELQACDTMNGNIVLISVAAAELTGNLDPVFSHCMGDYDYGLRAGCAGASVVAGRGFHGDCSRNPPGSAWYDAPTIRGRCQRVNTPKGLPMSEWAYFLSKHGGATWPLAWLSTYRRIFTEL